MAEASSLLAKIDEVIAEARRIRKAAEQKGDLHTVLNGLRTITNALALLGKVTEPIGGNARFSRRRLRRARKRRTSVPRHNLINNLINRNMARSYNRTLVRGRQLGY